MRCWFLDISIPPSVCVCVCVCVCMWPYLAPPVFSISSQVVRQVGSDGEHGIIRRLVGVCRTFPFDGPACTFTLGGPPHSRTLLRNHEVFMAILRHSNSYSHSGWNLTFSIHVSHKLYINSRRHLSRAVVWTREVSEWVSEWVRWEGGRVVRLLQWGEQRIVFVFVNPVRLSRCWSSLEDTVDW